MIKRKIIQEDSAISPIIGTILMVAITVIMAAIISSWSSGIKAPQTPATVGLDIQRLNQTHIQVTLTSIDPPGTQVTFVNFSDPVRGNEMVLNNSLGIPIGSTGQKNVTQYNVFVVGTTTFIDGTVKTIYSQRI